MKDFLIIKGMAAKYGRTSVPAQGNAGSPFRSAVGPGMMQNSRAAMYSADGNAAPSAGVTKAPFDTFSFVLTNTNYSAPGTTTTVNLFRTSDLNSSSPLPSGVTFVGPNNMTYAECLGLFTTSSFFFEGVKVIINSTTFAEQLNQDLFNIRKTPSGTTELNTQLADYVGPSDFNQLVRSLVASSFVLDGQSYLRVPLLQGAAGGATPNVTRIVLNVRAAADIANIVMGAPAVGVNARQLPNQWSA
jgi:hypothetical protein